MPTSIPLPVRHVVAVIAFGHIIYIINKLIYIITIPENDIIYFTMQIHREPSLLTLNPLNGRGNYIATSNNMKLVHWPLMGGLLHLVQRGGPGRAGAPPSPLLAVPNVTAHRSTSSVPTSYYLMSQYNCLCPLKG